MVRDLLGLSFCVLVCFGGELAQAQTQANPLPMVEWEKRQNAHERMIAFGDDLMGMALIPTLGQSHLNIRTYPFRETRDLKSPFGDGVHKAIFIIKVWT